MSPRRPTSILVIVLLLGATAMAQRGRPERDKPREIGLNDLFALCRPERAKAAHENVHFQTMGILRRTAELDKQGRFALVHPVAACCANGIAVGLCVRTNLVTGFTDGAQVIVRGHVRVAKPTPALPRGYMAQIKLGILRKHVEIVPTNIEVYDRLKDVKLVDVAAKLGAPEYATFARAVRATGWDKTLRQPSYFTVFAPTEHAFGRLSKAQRNALFAPANAEGLAALVRRHIAASWITKHSLLSQHTLATVGSDGIPIEFVNGRIRIGGARVLFQDAGARNGVVMALDRLLPAPKKAARDAARDLGKRRR